MHDAASPTLTLGLVRDAVRYESEVSVDAVRNRSQSEIGPVSHRTDHPPFRGSGPSDRGWNTSDGLARWRRGNRHAEAAADWTEIDLVWSWLELSDAEQRLECSQSAVHAKRHKGRNCQARHGHPIVGRRAVPR